MKKILIFLDELYHKNEKYTSKYNAGRFLLNLNKKYNLTYLLPISKEKCINTTTEIPDSVKVIKIGEWDSMLSYFKKINKNKKKLYQIMVEEIKNNDVVFVRLPSLPGLEVIKEANKQNKKIIIHIAGDIKEAYKTGKYSGVKKIIAKIVGEKIEFDTKRILRKSRNFSLLCTGNKLINDYIEFSPEFFIDNEFNINEYSLKNNMITEFLFVGRLIESKGLKYLIEAWKDIEYSLNIVGDGELKEYVNEEAQKNKKIQFHGFKSGQDLKNIYKKCSYLIVPSIGTEGFPRVIIEAWSEGMYVISTNVGGIEGIGEENSNITYISEKDIASIKGKVQQVINEKKYENKKNEIFKVAKKYSQDEMLKLLENKINY